MARRTQLVCLHEGEQGRSIDSVFINALLKKLDPAWLRPYTSNKARFISGGGRKELLEKFPGELRVCLQAGGQTTLMVWADVDDDKLDGDHLKQAFWSRAQADGITPTEFEQVVFIFAKDRLENWIEFLTTGTTDENTEGPRLSRSRAGKDAAEAGRRLAERCLKGESGPPLPPSLVWSCRNWHQLKQRMNS